MTALEEWTTVRPEANNIMPRLAKIADAAVAELVAELATEREHPTSVLQCAACQRLAVIQNARLEAENERLKRCGSCDHNGGTRCCHPAIVESGEYFRTGNIGRRNECHFTPSRWAERITP